MSDDIGDLTRQLEAAKKEIEELRCLLHTQKSTSEVIGELCHELRNPLSAMLGFCNLLMSDSPTPQLVSKQREYVGHVRTGLHHLLSLTNDVFDMVSHNLGKGRELKEDVINIEHFMEETLALVPGAESIELKWIPGPVALPRLYCDPVRLRQILLNIVGNAVKYAAETDGLVEVAMDISDGLAFIITDNGKGIRPEDIPRALTPFERIASSPLDRGLGLGLPLARALMEAHEGMLVLSSTPGHGTTVRLWFPPERVHLGTSHRPSEPSETTRKGRLLIAEDSLEMAKYLKDIAEAHGYETFMARLGRAAMDLAREKRPDVILMDVWLPDISGLEAVYWLKKEPRTADIPIIGITATGIPERWVLAGGCDAFFEKGDRGFIADWLRCAEEMVQQGAPSARLRAAKGRQLNLECMLAECVEWIQTSRVTTPDVKLSWQKDSVPLPASFIDPDAMRKILWQTISYAVLEIDQGGQIQIRTDSSDGFSIIIAHNRWTDESEIGLAPAMALVQQHGGRLAKEGNSETGTTMRISFPPERVCSATVH